jgi:prepilin-type N-terminal cleavage/methylation domain-containing protein
VRDRETSSRRRRQGGFTLIELMIAMVLMAIVVGFAMQIAFSVTSAFRDTRDAQGAERDVRSAIEFLSDVVRAGSSGVQTADLRDASNCTVAPAMAVQDHADAPDQLTILYASGGVLTSLRSVFTGASSSLDVMDATGLAVGDAVIVTNGDVGRLVAVRALSATTGAATIGTTAPTTACPSVTMPGSGFAIGSLVLRGKVARFYVAAANDGTPMLWMDPDGDGPAAGEPVAEGIEDMQVAVGVDLNGDGVLTDTASTTDEWFYNAAGDPAPPDPTVTRWSAIRISLVARTLGDRGPQTQSARPALEDRPAGAMDIYRRRTLSTVVQIRNLEPNL